MHKKPKIEQTYCYAVYLKEIEDISYSLDALFVLKMDAEEYANKIKKDGNETLIKHIPVKGIDFKIKDPQFGSIGNFIPVN